MQRTHTFQASGSTESMYMVNTLFDLGASRVEVEVLANGRTRAITATFPTEVMAFYERGYLQVAHSLAEVDE